MRERMPTAAAMLAQLRRQSLEFPPAGLLELTGERDGRPLFQFRWRSQCYPFVGDIRRLATPKALREAALSIRALLPEDASPLLIAPFLPEEQLAWLEAQGVSALDLCGNGVIAVRENLLVWRSGSPSRFSWEGRIKNVYRGHSALVGRLFLLTPEFSSARDLEASLRSRGGSLTPGTISRVCSGLQDDLVVEQLPGKGRQRSLRLLQADRLLERLTAEYRPPDIRRTAQGKCRAFGGLEQAMTAGPARAVFTGASSVDAYAVQAREPLLRCYCADLDGALRALGDDFQETGRFADLELLETPSAWVYFDRRGRLASPLQVYLELMQGDKRDRETAGQVRRHFHGG